MRGPVRLLLVDNVDSFTFMLADTLAGAGADLTVVRNRDLSVAEALAAADAIVVSPGPGRPEQAGISIPLAAACVAARRPYLGVCLGHQALALACGGTVARVAPVHGKVAAVRHDGRGLFAGLDSPTEMTRYHSLAIARIGPSLVATAMAGDVVMAVEHRAAPAYGVQFHPESVASTDGPALLRNFVRIVAGA